MKKRLFVCLLSLAMIFTMTPVTMAADQTFTDVPDGAWYEEAVDYVYDNDLMAGTSDTTFSPDSTTTRGMLVTILYRLAGSPDVSSNSDFTDVADNTWYTQGVAWATANEIVSGYGDGRFGPEDPITREQMAAILYRYAEWAGYDVSESADLTGFSDYNQISDYAKDDLSWANAEGLIVGTSDTTMSPQGYATRAQVAAILYRFCEKVVNGNGNTPETETFTVTFQYNYDNEGAYKTVEVKSGETVSEPSDPTRSGYTFNGWYTSATGGDEFDFSTPITQDVTLYASWTSTGGNVSTHVHSYTSEITTEPTCTETGIRTYTCSCGATFTEVLPATGHSFTWASNNDGTHTGTCTKCGYVSDPQDCTYGEAVIKSQTGNVTVTEETCTVCGYKNVTTITTVSDGLATFDNGVDTGYVVSSETGLTTLNDEINGEPNLGDFTISLSGDLDLSDTTWNPINVNGYQGTGVITVEGNGATITGLTAPLFDGGFAGNSGIVIKDLTIENANINDSTNTQGLGAFISTVDSMETITLTNCHLKDSTIVSTGGARVGGLIGWTSGYDVEDDGPVDTNVTIDNCSVTGCTITANGSVGGIIGHEGCNSATYHTITNCTVTDNTLTSNDDSYRVGVVVGTANVGQVSISDTTSSGNTLVQNNNGTEISRPDGQSDLYGRFVPGSTGILIIDGVYYVVGGTSDSAKAAVKAVLTEDVENIEVELTGDIVYDVNNNSSANMGGESTKTITINGNNHNIIFNNKNSDYCQINATDGLKLTIKNATINNSGYHTTGGTWNNHDITFNCEVDFENVEFDNAVALKNNSVLKNVTINDDGDDNDNYSAYLLWITAEGQTVTLDGCNIIGDGADDRAIAIKDQYVDTPEKVTLNVSNTTITSKTKAAILVTSTAGADITLSNVDITGVDADKVNAVWVDDARTAYYDLVTVTGGTKIQEQ